MVGKTPRVLKDERARLQTIKIFCGCLPCLLRGHLDRWTTIEHVTERGRRVGVKSDEHANTIGLCMWHHFGACDPGLQRAGLISELGPALADGGSPRTATSAKPRQLNVTLPDVVSHMPSQMCNRLAR